MYCTKDSRNLRKKRILIIEDDYINYNIDKFQLISTIVELLEKDISLPYQVTEQQKSPLINLTYRKNERHY